jgi:hypothetical protein
VVAAQPARYYGANAGGNESGPPHITGMAEPIAVLALRRKRDQISGTIAHYERLLREAEHDLAHINASLRLFEATGDAADLPPYVDLNRVLTAGRDDQDMYGGPRQRGTARYAPIGPTGNPGQGPKHLSFLAVGAVGQPPPLARLGRMSHSLSAPRSSAAALRSLYRPDNSLRPTPATPKAPL